MSTVTNTVDPAHPFGRKAVQLAVIDPVRCTGCGWCAMFCECNVVLLQIGCTIAVHTGPYALGMGVMRRWKKA